MYSDIKLLSNILFRSKFKLEHIIIYQLKFSLKMLYMYNDIKLLSHILFSSKFKLELIIIYLLRFAIKMQHMYSLIKSRSYLYFLVKRTFIQNLTSNKGRVLTHCLKYKTFTSFTLYSLDILFDYFRVLQAFAGSLYMGLTYGPR